MAEGFTAAAAWEHCYQWTTVRQVVFPEKLRARQGWADAGGERVSDVRYGHAVLAEKRLFEGKNAEQLVDDAAHRPYPAFSPCPDLGSYEVNDWNAEALEFAGDPEVEIGRVGEDGEVGFALGGGSDQFPESTPDAGEMAQHFHDPDDRQILGADDGFHACFFPEMRARAAEEMALGPAAAKLANQFGGVVVAGGFSGRYQNGARGAGQPSE